MTSNVEVVLEAIRAVEERDRETLFGLYHDEVEFHDTPSLPYGGSSRGREALRMQLETAPEETSARNVGAPTADRARAADGCPGGGSRRR